MRIRIQRERLPWAMAAGRALLGPVLIAGEKCGWNGLTLAWIVVATLMSDIFDGVLARRWRCDTAGVRLFDSMADTVFYGCVTIAIWIGQPQLLRDNAGLLAALLALEGGSFGLNFAKFGKPASYHSYLAKAWGLTMATAVVAVFASRHARPLLPVALALGIACNLEGLAMSLVLPVWRKDVKTLHAAWRLRVEMRGRPEMRKQGTANQARRASTARRITVAGGALMLLLWLLAVAPAFAMEPGQAGYAGGTAGIATGTFGVLDTTSPTLLIFKLKKPDGTPGQIEIEYKNIRNFESRNEVAHHLGVLPAIAVVLAAPRVRRYFFTINYADSGDAVQVAIFEVSKRDQPAVLAILRARGPQICNARPNACGAYSGVK